MQEHSKRSQSQQVHESPATPPPRRRSRKGGQVTETASTCDSPPPNTYAPPQNRQDGLCAVSYSTDGLEAPQGASQKPPTPSYTANAKGSHGCGGGAGGHGGGSANQVGPPMPKTITLRGHTANRAPARPTAWPPRPRPSSRQPFQYGMTIGSSSRAGAQQEVPVAQCARLFGRAAPSPAKPVGVAGD